ncbi:MAG: SusC/RagA family TonB-linked outer membrane protein, partial [Bacteroidales bacterium]|nr:SusC/RagA family TonB-linked outer membrane protein [Bacteroidales bacterium]
SVAANPSFFRSHLTLNLHGKGMLIHSDFDPGVIGNAVNYDPTKPIYSADSPYHGYWSWTGADDPYNPGWSDNYESAKNLYNKFGAGPNPVSKYELNDNTADVKNFIGSAQLEYKSFFVPGLKVNYNLSIDASKSDGSTVNIANKPDNFAGSTIGNQNDWTQKRRNSQMDLYATYAKDIDAIKSKFDIMAGYSWQHYYSEGDYWYYAYKPIDVNGPIDDTNSILDEDNSHLTDGFWANEHYIVSFFTRINYSLLDRYLVTFTLRNDGSSRFNKDNRWGLFPSAALAWRISQEKFLQDQDVVSSLKLRLGWGKTGQQDINQGDYPYLGTYNYSTNTASSYYRNGEWVALLKPNAYNDDLKWETTTTWNAGIDFGFLHDRLYGSFDWYFRETTDLINTEAKTPSGSNFAEYVVANIGNLTNTGVEFTLGAVLMDKRDFQWKLDVNAAYNKNEITKLSSASEDTDIRRFQKTSDVDGATDLKAHSVNNPAGMYYVFQQVYDANGKPIEGAFVDRNNDGTVNESDLYLYHNADPDVTFGISSRWQYKKFDLSLAGHGSIGNWNYYGVAANGAATNAQGIYSAGALVNKLASAFETSWQQSWPLSDYYIRNASFFRVDNITLGYSFDKIGGEQSFLKGISGRIYATVQNPLVFTKYDGLDPEISGGVDNSFYPRPVTYLLGLNLNF